MRPQGNGIHMSSALLDKDYEVKPELDRFSNRNRKQILANMPAKSEGTIGEDTEAIDNVISRWVLGFKLLQIIS